MEGMSYFKERLLHTDPMVRRQTIEELLEMELDPELEVEVAHRLEDCDRGVRDAAAQFVLHHQSPPVLEYLASLMGSDDIAVRNLAGDLLVKIGAPAIEYIAPYVHHDNHDVRKFAIDLLALLPEEAAYLAEDVAAHFNDPDANVVCAAIDAIGAFRAEKYADQLVQLFHQFEYARPNVVSAISRFPHRVDPSFFRQALMDEDPVVQLTAAEALARLHDIQWLDLLIEQADKINELARPIVLKAIAELVKEVGDYSIIPNTLLPYFIEMAQDMDETFVEAAVEVLVHFPNELVMDVLISRIGIKDELDLMIYQKLVTAGVEALERLLEIAARNNLPPNTVAQFVIGFMSSFARSNASFLTSPVAAQALEYLNQHFYDFTAEVKTAILEMCRSFQFPKFCGVIENAVRDMDPVIQNYALDVLKDVANDDIREEIVRILEDDSLNPEAIQQLQQIQGKAC